MIQAFMKLFYRTISFEAGRPFPSEAFRALFLPQALLLERTEDGGYVSKTVEEHIVEFERALREYPQLFAAGFHEEQTSLEWTEQDGVYLLHSGFEKRYVRDGAPVVEQGTNHFTVAEVDGRLRIACAVW